MAFYIGIYRQVVLSCSGDYEVRLTLLTERLYDVRLLFMLFDLLYASLVMLWDFGMLPSVAGSPLFPN